MESFLLKNLKSCPIRLCVIAAHVFGVKYCTEGFYTVDALDYVSNEYSVQEIRQIETYILKNKAIMFECFFHLYSFQILTLALNLHISFNTKNH